MAEPQQSQRPFTFGELVKGHQRLVQSGVDMSLPDFSQVLNEATGNQGLADAGLKDSNFKRLSLAFDELLEPASQVSEGMFGALGKAISPGLEQTGKDVGKALPRGIVDFGTTALGLALTPAAPAVGVPLAAAGATSAFGKGYTDTGSKAVGAIQAATGLAAPGVGGLGMRLGGKTAAKLFSRGNPVVDRLAEFVGSEISLVGLNEVTRQMANVAMGQGLTLPGQAEMFENIVGTVPFLPFEGFRAVRGARSGQPSVAQSIRIRNRATEALRTRRDTIQREATETAQRQQLEFDLNDERASQLEFDLNIPVPAPKDVEPVIRRIREQFPDEEMPENVRDMVTTVEDVNQMLRDGKLPDGTPLNPKQRKAAFQARSAALSVLGKWEAHMQESPTLFGKPIVDRGVAAQSLLQFAAEQGVPTTAAEAAARTRRAHDEANKALVEAASVAISNKLAFSDADGLRQVAELANEVASANGDAPVVTDKMLQGFLKKFRSTKTKPEQLQNIAQRVENLLTKSVERLTKLEDEIRRADEWIIGLDPEMQRVVSEAIVLASQRTSSHRFSDIISRRYGIVARGLVERGRLAGLSADEAVSKLAKMLHDSDWKLMGNVLQKQGLFARAKILDKTPLSEPDPRMEGGEVPNKGKVSEEGNAVAEDSIADFVTATAATDAEIQLVPVTAAELAEVGVKASKDFVNRVNFEMQKAARGEPFGQGTAKHQAAIRKVYARRLHLLGQLKPGTGPGETLQQVARFVAGEVDQPGPLPQNALLAATQNIAHRHFLMKGFSPDDARSMAEVFTRVAAHFRNVENTRITELISDEGLQFGLTINYDENTPSIVALNLRNLSRVVGEEDVKNFFKLAGLGHELFHRSDNMARTAGPNSQWARVIQRMQEWYETTDPDLRSSVLTDAFFVLLPTKAFNENRTLIQGLVDAANADVREYMATYASLMVMGQARPTGFKPNSVGEMLQHLRYSDKHVQDFGRMLFNDLEALTDVMKDMAVMADADRNVRGKFIVNLNKTVKEFMKLGPEVDQAVGKLRALESLLPDNYADLAMAGRLDVPIEVGADYLRGVPGNKTAAVQFMQAAGLKKMTPDIEKWIGAQPNWYERFLVPPPQLRELYPMLNPITDLVYKFRGRVNNLLNQVMINFGQANKMGKAVLPKDAPIRRVASSTHLEEAYGKVALAQNDLQRPVKDVAEVKSIAPGLTDADAQTIFDLHRQQAKAMENMEQFILKDRMDTLADGAAALFLNESNKHQKHLTALRAAALGQEYRNARFALIATPGDAVALATMQRLKLQVGEVAMAHADELFAAVTPKLQELRSTLAKRRGWFSPEVRLGRFMVRFRDTGNKFHFEGYKTKAEATARLAELESDTTVLANSIGVTDKWSRTMDVNTLYPDVLNQFRDIEQTALDKALMAIEDEAQRETIRKLVPEPGTAAFREIMSKSFGAHLLRRKGVAGRERINFVEGMVAYIEGLSTGISKAATKRRAALLLDDPLMKVNPEIKRQARDYTISVVDPPTREWSFVKRMGFQYFMGGNLSSILVELGQSLFTLAPELVRRGTGVAGSYFAIGRAAKEYMRLAAGKPRADIDEAVKQAQRDQVIDFGVFQEIADIDEESFLLSLRNMSKGEDPISPADLIRKPLYQYMKFTEGLYRRATSINSRLAFIAGFMHAAGDKPLKVGSPEWQRAYEMGTRITQNTMFGGGAAARPGVFNRLGKVYGAVGALYSLRHYTVSTIAMMYRFAKDSIDGQGLGAAEKSAARKALAQMAGTQVFFAGTMGLPMASGLLAILDNMFNLNLKQDVREVLDELAGDDDEMGQILSDVAMHGVVSAALPVDVASRFGLGDAFGLDPNAGFTPNTLFGVPGGLVKRWVTGVQEGVGASGDRMKGLQAALPNSIANLVKMYANDGKVKAPDGSLLFEPTEFEKLISSIGLKPKRLGKLREEQQLTRRTEELAARRERRFTDTVSDLIIEGDMAGAREAILSRAAADDVYDPRSGARSIVDKAVRKTLPVDQQRTGLRASVRERESIRGSVGSDLPRVSETELYLRKKALEQQLGIPGLGVPSRYEMTKAQLVDRLMALNPTLSRQRAAMIVESQIGRTSPLAPTGGTP